MAQVAAELGIGCAILDEHAADEDAFGRGALAGAGDLEALAGMGGEAIQVQAVVPVRPADEGQLMGPQVGHGVGDAAAQVLHQGLGQALVIVEGYLLHEDGEIAGFLDVGIRTGNEPQGVVVEAGAHGQIALLGQGLVLVVGAAVRELGGSNVQQTLPGLFGNHMHEAQQVLTGIPEAHATAHAAFKIAGGAGHIEGHHALVLVPDVHHPVYLFVPGLGGAATEQIAPELPQPLQGPVEGGGGSELFHHGVGFRLVDDPGGDEFCFLGIFNIAKAQNQLLFLAGGQLQVKLHGAHRCPAVGVGAGAAAV